jgi:hypothetical protein
MTQSRDVLCATLVLLVVAGSGCAPVDPTGYYGAQAEAECRARGHRDGTKDFYWCARGVSEAEYQRYNRGAPGG